MGCGILAGATRWNLFFVSDVSHVLLFSTWGWQIYRCGAGAAEMGQYNNVSSDRCQLAMPKFDTLTML